MGFQVLAAPESPSPPTLLWRPSRLRPGSTPLHSIHHTVKSSNRVLFCWSPSVCGRYPTLHIILPGHLFHLNRPPTLCCKPNLSMDVIQPTLNLSLNPSKTEFIIIGLPAQIKKIPDFHTIVNFSSTTFISDTPVRTLGVTFDPHLILQPHLQPFPLLLHSHTWSPPHLTVFWPMLDFKLPPPLPPPLSTQNLQLTTVTRIPLYQPRLPPNTASTAHPKFILLSHPFSTPGHLSS